jgi:diamine N-acetyltransferase
MLSDETQAAPPPEQPEIGVWRFMIDARHQGQGIGAAAAAPGDSSTRAGAADRFRRRTSFSYCAGPRLPREPFLPRPSAFSHNRPGASTGHEVCSRLALVDAGPH